MAQWLSGYKYRKTCVVRAPSTNPVADWLHIELTDPDILGEIADGGDIRVTSDDGVTPLVHKLLSATSTLVRIVVLVTKPTGATDVTVYVYAGTSGGTAVGYTTVGNTNAVPASALSLSYTTAGGAKTESIHPEVLLVPAGSWMKDVDGSDGTVTHVMVDTPYPGWDNDYENPSLMYSTDDGATWVEWPGLTNPIDAFPGGADFNSDPGMAILASGDLRVFYRPNIAGVSSIVYRDVSGDDLTNNVVIAAEAACTFPVDGELPRSPSIIKASAALWYCYGQGDDDANCGPIIRWQSVDEGVNWTDKATVIAVTGGENVDAYWHGQMAGPFGGWYYAIWSEGRGTTDIISSNGDVRMFRSRDPAFGSYEPGLAFVVARGGAPPTWAEDALYKPSIFEKSDGTLGVIFSGVDSGAPNTANVGRIATVPQSAWTTSTIALGHGRTTAAETEDTEVATWDCAEGGGSGLNDLTANSHTLTVIGAPTYTANTGYVFLQTGADRLDADFTLNSLGNDFLIEVEFTVPATVDQTANHVILGDCAAVQGLRFIFVKDTGKTVVACTNTDTTAYSNASANPDVRDGAKHCAVIEYKSSASLLRYYIDGAFVAGYAVAANKAIRDTSGAFSLAGLQGLTAGAQYADITIHRCRVASSVSRQHSTTFGPSVKWTADHETIPPPHMLLMR